jgi:tRNA(fMet)-specific endonuclease VapC
LPGHLLDANVVIDWLNGRPAAVSLLAELIGRGEALAANAVVVAEVYAGLRESDRRQAERIFASLDYWQIEERVAQLAGEYRYQYARRGRTLTTTDVLLAAHAVSRDATLVTGNIRDFPMPELRVLRMR